MTKLNYNNRKSDGVKLAAIVAKDLRKRVKPCTPKTENLSAIELSLDSKILTDNGLKELGPALAEALNPPPGYAVSRLQTLHLQGNALTAKSLHFLGPALLAAARDLEILDLSDNYIGVEDRDDAESWEVFLVSLRRCTNLRILDLGKNNFDNCRALEIFARVYLKQFRTAVLTWVDFLCEDGDRGTSVASSDGFVVVAPDEDDEDAGEQSTGTPLSSRDFNQSRSRALTGQKDGAAADNQRQNACSVSGLPSIAFIDMRDSFLGDNGALFMSSIIERHRWSQDHIFQRKWGSHLDGRALLALAPNEKLTNQGMKLLKLAEKTSYQPAGIAGIEEVLAPRDRANALVDGLQVHRLRSKGSGRLTATYRSLLNVSPMARRLSASDVSSNSDFGTPLSGLQTSATGIAESIDWLRTRTERSVIDERGVKQVELWHAAMKLLCHVRATMIEDRTHVNFPSLPIRQACVQQPAVEESMVPAKRAPLIMRLPSPPRPAPTYAAKLLGKKSVTAMTAPQLPNPQAQVFTAPSARRRPTTAKAPTQRPRSPTDKTLQLPEPQTKMVGPLPEQAWFLVMCELADPKRLLNERQRASILEYGRDRKTLKTELEVLGKAVSHQVWRVLEHLGCLLYEDELEKDEEI